MLLDRCYPPAAGQGRACRRGVGGREGAGETLVTPRCCRAPAASPAAQWDPLGLLLNRGRDNIADVPSSVQELRPWLSLPQAGGAAQGCRRLAEVRTGRSCSSGIPPVESSAPHLATGLLGFGPLCLAVSPSLGLPTQTPSPGRPPGSSSSDRDGGTLKGARRAAAAPTGEL